MLIAKYAFAATRRSSGWWLQLEPSSVKVKTQEIIGVDKQRLTRILQLENVCQVSGNHYILFIQFIPKYKHFELGIVSYK